MYTVKDFYQQHSKQLGLELIAGKNGLKRRIHNPEAHRPGLSLSGYLKNYAKKRILVFGKVEIEYLRELSAEVRFSRLAAILTSLTPAVIIARGHHPSKEFGQLCEQNKIPLFRVKMPTTELLSKLIVLLTNAFTNSSTFHGTLVEIYGLGVLIRGDSSVGKSEAALGLLDRGHRLVSDDAVCITKKDVNFLEGRGPELARHHMDIRGIGIINAARLYGPKSIKDQHPIDIVVDLETSESHLFCDKMGLGEKHCDILGVKIPCYTLAVQSARDVVLLLETIVLNHRLKCMGYHSENEFKAQMKAKEI